MLPHWRPSLHRKIFSHTFNALTTKMSKVYFICKKKVLNLLLPVKKIWLTCLVSWALFSWEATQWDVSNNIHMILIVAFTVIGKRNSPSGCKCRQISNYSTGSSWKSMEKRKVRGSRGLKSCFFSEGQTLSTISVEEANNKLSREMLQQTPKELRTLWENTLKSKLYCYKSPQKDF